MRARPIYVYAAATCALLVTAAGVWLWHTQAITPGELLATARQHASDPAAPLVVVLVYVIGGFVLVPVTALIAVTGLAFGPVHGALYALLGAAASGACSYAAGRHLSVGILRRYAGPRVEAVRKQLKARGLLAVILVRMVPSGPYTLVNLIAGASSIRFRDFLLGTVIGMTPGVVATVGLVQGARAVWQAPEPVMVAALVLAAAAVVGLGYALRRALLRRRTGQRPSPK